MTPRLSPDGFLLSLTWPKLSSRPGKGTEQGYLLIRRVGHSGRLKQRWGRMVEQRGVALQWIADRRDDSCDSALHIYCRLCPWHADGVASELLSGAWADYLPADLSASDTAAEIRRYGHTDLPDAAYETLRRLAAAIESPIIDQLRPSQQGTLRHLLDCVYEVFADERRTD